jgi:hypothetical protein
MSGETTLGVLYEYLVQSTSNPDRFEFGDEVLDTLEERAKPHFAKALNAILESMDLQQRVRLLKEIEGNAETKKSEQAHDFVVALNALFEKVREEPCLLKKIVPQTWVEKEQEDLLAKYQAMTEEYYGLPQPMELTPETVISWDKSNLEFLESPTMLDDMVRFGSTLVKDFEDVWRALFLAQASCFAPGIAQGEKDHRAQIHILLVGEYSTSKSGLAGYATKMFPKVVRCSDTTGVGLMGSINRRGEKMTGLAEEADRSVLVLDEFEKMLKRTRSMDGILRAIMEDQYFSRKTAYGNLQYETRPSILAMANPKHDVFYSNESLASQVPFKNGLLSRFDYLKPLAYSKDKINGIARFIAQTSFKRFEGQGHMTTRDVLKSYYALNASMRELKVRQVGAEESLLMDIHERFTALQREVDDVPLLSVRDFMSAMRVFNASAILHHKQRKVDDGIVLADDQDRDNAIYILDNSVKSREMLLSSCRRADVCHAPVEKAYGQVMSLLQREGSMNKQDAVDYLMRSMSIGQSTAYKYLDQIVGRGKEIKQDGQRNAMLVLA